MPFFEETKKTRETYNADDMRQATQLRNALAKRLLTKRVSLKQWAHEFARLRRAYSTEEVQKTLDWYCANMQGDYTPRALSASSFRKKYDAIDSASKRPEEQNKNLTITPEAKRIAERLALRWPNNEKGQEVAFIQISFNNYAELRTKLLEARAAKETPDRLRRFAAYLLERLPSDRTMIEKWLLAVHKMAWSWDAWKGNLIPWAWSTRQKTAKAMLADIGRDYSGIAYNIWDKLAERISL